MQVPDYILESVDLSCILPLTHRAGSLNRFAFFGETMGSASYIWMDDSLRPASEGVVPFLSAGVQYGFSVLEAI